MIKKTCYLFVFDGFADYEVSIAAAGIRKSHEYRLRTISFRKEPVVAMSGLTIVPDLDFLSKSDLADMEPDNTAMLILPGGAAWEQHGNKALIPMVEHFLQQGIPVAAICGATILLGELGILNRVVHTSNAMEYLAAHAGAYRGQALYRSQPSVRTENMITANGTAATEFAHDVFESLGIVQESGVSEWFQYFEKAVA